MKTSLTVAAAQSRSRWGDIVGNVRHHYLLARRAADAGAHIVIFPELSLTGYPDRSPPKLLSPTDSRLSALRALASSAQVTIVAGAPVLWNGAAAIAAMVFQPNGTLAFKYKTLLHPGEERFFAAGPELPPLKIQGQSISLAICAEAGERSHFESARASGATLYVVAALESPNSYPNLDRRFSDWSSVSSISILLANHAEASGSFQSAGQSALWTASGVAAVAPSDGPALVIASLRGSGWTAEVLR